MIMSIVPLKRAVADPIDESAVTGESREAPQVPWLAVKRPADELAPTVAGALIKHYRREGDDPKTWDAMIEAAELARTLCGHALRVRTATLKDESRTVAARHKAIRDATKKMRDQIEQRFDQVRALAAAHAAELDKMVAGPPAPKNHSEAAEMRAVLRAMTEAQRKAVLATALNEGDDAIIAAVTSGKPFLSGMTADGVRVLAVQWAVRNHPGLIDTGEREGARTRLSKAASALESMWPDAMVFLDSLSDPVLIDRAEKAHAAAEQARQEAEQAVAAATKG
jgi:hypothetical protein